MKQQTEKKLQANLKARLINEDTGDYADGVDDAMDEFDEDW